MNRTSAAQDEHETSKQDQLAQSKSAIERKVIAITTTGVLLSAIAYHLIPTDGFQAALASPIDRIVFTIRWNVLTVAMIVIMVIYIGRVRLSCGQMDPLSNVDRDKVEVHVRVLTNTMETFVQHFTGQLIISTWLEPVQMGIIPILVILFVVGRIIYWRGYLDPSDNHGNRALGLPLTYFPNAIMVIYGIFKLIV